MSGLSEFSSKKQLEHDLIAERAGINVKYPGILNKN